MGMDIARGYEGQESDTGSDTGELGEVILAMKTQPFDGIYWPT